MRPQLSDEVFAVLLKIHTEKVCKYLSLLLGEVKKAEVLRNQGLVLYSAAHNGYVTTDKGLVVLGQEAALRNQRVVIIGGN